MSALLEPVNCKGSSVKWGLVVHTMAMFLFVTMYTAMTLHIQSVSFIDDSGFFGSDVLVPGPIGYQVLLFSRAINIVPAVIFFFNNWLADGLVVSAASSPVIQVSDKATPPALPLLYYLFQELLGHPPPSTGVPRFLRYVLE